MPRPIAVLATAAIAVADSRTAISFLAI